MNGYRRIKSLQTNEPSSAFSLSPSQTKHKHKSNQQSQESKTHEPRLEIEIGDTYTEKRSGSGAPKFRRNASISSSSSSSSSSVKRAFSIRRSSSFSERYCRIHDQHAALSSPPDDEEFDQSFSKEKKSGRKRILKSCKRIFGL